MNYFLRLVVYVFASCFAQVALACSFSIVYSDQASPPYYLGDGEAIPANPGITVELLTQAAAKMGCKIDWKRLPNRRALRELESGAVQAMMLLSYSPERAAYAVYPMLGDAPDPAYSLATLSHSVYVKTGSTFKWENRQFSPAQALVGVNAGYSAADEVRKLGLSVEEATSTTNNLQKLLMGRIAAYVGQDLQVDLVIEDKHLTGVQKLPVPFSSKDYYLPFSKQFFDKSSASAIQLWKHIAEVRKAQGKALAKKYLDLY
ncbi:transporter substrate-binding domain-containing protein [Rhodoferax saidenbachensis]|uniref:Polar amino acid transport system substrate-binding protein n=1 Tax=Rhodoferax saidenbachensis TaxID=1484693 RepID=A0ABU1ZPE4_9BURK|nr:transporter substrate-binding domain-containing protein [Rhodoferax saidenbachensis]MDR7307263.1 polar amino acid transport system substrate-binding protein [Rhodoferax saidenbachensis]